MSVMELFLSLSRSYCSDDTTGGGGGGGADEGPKFDDISAER